METKTSPNDYAFPKLDKLSASGWTEAGPEYYHSESTGGLTKREYLAAIAMNGIASANFSIYSQDSMTIAEVAERAVKMADALIVELSK